MSYKNNRPTETVKSLKDNDVLKSLLKELVDASQPDTVRVREIGEIAVLIENAAKAPRNLKCNICPNRLVPVGADENGFFDIHACNDRRFWQDVFPRVKDNTIVFQCGSLHMEAHNLIPVMVGEHV